MSLTQREALICELFTHASELEVDALRVIATIAKRAVMGRRQYGDLNLATDPRQFRQETIAEHVDGTFYAACELIRMEDGIS